jgi:hypothetical protein
LQSVQTLCRFGRFNAFKSGKSVEKRMCNFPDATRSQIRVIEGEALLAPDERVLSLLAQYENAGDVPQ